MIEYNEEDQIETPPDELGVKVIGVGGAGANVLDRMALEGSDEAELLTLNTDMRVLSTSVASEKIQLGATLLKGMGAGGDPELGRQAALEAIDEIRDAVRGSKMVFVCVGLGGGTGSGAAPEVCRIAKEEGVFLVVFAALPFSFEGERRMVQATDALDKIGRYADAVVTFDNDRMGELIVPKEGVTQAFAAADKLISQSIRATIAVVYRPGIIRIGMDELLTALQSKKSRCLFGYGVAKGEDRAIEAVEKALRSPLIDQGRLLNDSHSVLVQVSGGDSMTLYEVQLVMDEINKHIGPETQVLFGTGADNRLGNSLAVTVLSSIGGRAEPSEGVEEPGDVVTLGDVREPEAPASPLAAAMTGADLGEAPAVEPVYEPVVQEPAAPSAQQPAAPARAPAAQPAAVESQPAVTPATSGQPVRQPAPVEPEPEPVPAQPMANPQPVVHQEPAPAPEPVAPVPSVAASPVEPERHTQPAPAVMEPVAAEPALAEPAPVAAHEEPRREQREPSPEVFAASGPPAVDDEMTNPIARAVSGGQAAAPAPEPAESQQAPPAEEPPAQRVETSPQPVKLSPFSPEEEAVASNPAPVAAVRTETAEAGRIEATTDSAQTISLSRIVPTGNTGRIQTRDPHAARSPGPVDPNLPPKLAPASDPEPPELGLSPQEAHQQQELLQLEPVATKGRFAKTDPTIVDGEDLDIPTFLRKRKE